ncbi:MAG: C4-dicarboxylate ABC transporter substrate-binding protein [Rhodospirillaceae bacterium]|nr:C4-dicarboxylate ABC transporter substrate-binding protein [Rhodospirillaceae bacterium]
MTRILRVVLLAAGLIGLGHAANADEYRMMTGPQGGSWYPLGGAIANLVRETMPDVSIRVLPGGGIANVLAVEKGKAQLSFGNANSTADAIAGRPPFGEEAPHIRHVATLYPQVFQVIVAADSGINSIADMKGRNVAVGLRGHTGEQIARQLLGVEGLTYDDLGSVNHVNYTDSVSLMKDGHIDAFMIITTIPASAVMDVATARSVRVMDIPDGTFEALREKHNPNYVRRTIPANTYPDQPDPVQTLGTWTHLIAADTIPDEVVYTLVKSLDEHRADLGAIVSAMKDVSVETFATDVGVPFHPGAERYYREVGVLP